jgi:hypothetical protein
MNLSNQFEQKEQLGSEGNQIPKSNRRKQQAVEEKEERKKQAEMERERVEKIKMEREMKIKATFMINVYMHTYKTFNELISGYFSDTNIELQHMYAYSRTQVAILRPRRIVLLHNSGDRLTFHIADVFELSYGVSIEDSEKNYYINVDENENRYELKDNLQVQLSDAIKLENGKHAVPIFSQMMSIKSQGINLEHMYFLYRMLLLDQPKNSIVRGKFCLDGRGVLIVKFYFNNLQACIDAIELRRTFEK